MKRVASLLFSLALVAACVFTSAGCPEGEFYDLGTKLCEQCRSCDRPGIKGEIKACEEESNSICDFDCIDPKQIYKHFPLKRCDDVTLEDCDRQNADACSERSGEWECVKVAQRGEKDYSVRCQCKEGFEGESCDRKNSSTEAPPNFEETNEGQETDKGLLAGICILGVAVFVIFIIVVVLAKKNRTIPSVEPGPPLNETFHASPTANFYRVKAPSPRLRETEIPLGGAPSAGDQISMATKDFFSEEFTENISIPISLSEFCFRVFAEKIGFTKDEINKFFVDSETKKICRGRLLLELWQKRCLYVTEMGPMIHALKELNRDDLLKKFENHCKKCEIDFESIQQK